MIILILIAAFVLRVVNVGHSLSWDEAWNVNSIMDGATGNTDPESTFFPNLLRHPPAYTGIGLLYAMVTRTDRFGLATALEVLSILFSLALIFAVFICGREWFGESAGLAASFVFALMPAARVFDTWIKQESMTLFFGLLFLFFFFRKRYLLSGLFLGVSMLTKEIAVFVILAVGLFILVLRRWREIRGFIIANMVAFAVCAWWYLFVSTTKGMFLEFFLGRHVSAIVWRKPWHFYFARIPQDLGWGISALALLGLVFILRQVRLQRAHQENKPSDMEPFSKGEFSYFLLSWIAAVYIPLSFSFGKPPWMVYSAFPAFALLSGWGVSGLIEVVKSKRRRTIVFGLGLGMCALAFVPSILISFKPFVKRADVMHEVNAASKRVAEYINEQNISGARVMMRLNDLTPVFAFYLESYKPGSMVLLPLEGRVETDFHKHRIFLLDNNTGIEKLFEYAKRVRPHYYLSTRNARLGRELSRYVKPKMTGVLLLFDLRPYEITLKVIEGLGFQGSAYLSVFKGCSRITRYASFPYS